MMLLIDAQVRCGSNTMLTWLTENLSVLRSQTPMIFSTISVRLKVTIFVLLW